MRLEGKTAIITGAASGIGRASALKMAAEGASLLVVDIQKEGAEETAKQVKDAGGKCLVHVGDVSVQATMEEAVKVAIQEYGLVHAFPAAYWVQLLTPVATHLLPALHAISHTFRRRHRKRLCPTPPRLLGLASATLRKRRSHGVPSIRIIDPF